MKKTLVCALMFFTLSSAMVRADEAKIKKDILNVLWLPASAKLPAKIAATLKDDRNNAKRSGERIVEMFDRLENTRIPLVTRYPERYALLKKAAARGLDPYQQIRIINLTAPDYYYGFKTMRDGKALSFPKDMGPHPDYQFAWHFLVGNLKDEAGNDYGVECVFFRRAMMAPPFAKAMGISEMDNQVMELQYAVSFAKKNLQAAGSSPVIAGSTGLVKYGIDPFLVAVGRNKIQSLKKGALFPMKLQYADPDIPMAVDITMHNAKPVLIEGDNGKAPDVAGIGSWYFSVPDIQAQGTITYKGESIKVKGKMWLDNQWTAGMMPIGYAPNLYIRALSNVLDYFQGKSKEYGWDWYCLQLDDDTEITVSAGHPGGEDIDNKGPNPPGRTERECFGKYVDKSGKAFDLKGKLTINKWSLSKKSHCWYPNGWEFSFPTLDLFFIMEPIVDYQILEFASSAEYREGATRLKGTRDGKKITGYGFAEGVNYIGHDWTYKQLFGSLGIKDTPANRALMQTKRVSTWMLLKSVIVLLLPLFILIALIICLYKLLKHRR